MEVTRAQVRAFRLRAHHLDRRLPPEGLLAAAGACGIQNSPPGAFETAMFNRVEGCSPQALRRALYEERRLLQAWSYRGAPVVFPAEESGAFLTALIAREGEAPWIYTQGIGLALDFLGMDADDLLFRVKDACALLDGRTVRGKEALDQALADAVEPGLPTGKRALWRAPSMYGGAGQADGRGRGRLVPAAALLVLLARRVRGAGEREPDVHVVCALDGPRAVGGPGRGTGACAQVPALLRPDGRERADGLARLHAAAGPAHLRRGGRRGGGARGGEAALRARAGRGGFAPGRAGGRPLAAAGAARPVPRPARPGGHFAGARAAAYRLADGGQPRRHPARRARRGDVDGARARGEAGRAADALRGGRPRAQRGACGARGGIRGLPRAAPGAVPGGGRVKSCHTHCA